MSHQLGQAAARLVSTPLPTNEEGYNSDRDWSLFPWDSDLRSAIGFYIDEGRRIQKSVPNYNNAFISESLCLIESQVESVDRYPRVLFHEDFSNFHVHEGRLAGLFDLEMCRSGTELMQVNMLLGLERAGLDRDSMKQGYVDVMGPRPCLDDTLGLIAMDHLARHIRVCRYGRWDGSAESIVHSEHYVSTHGPPMRRLVMDHAHEIDLQQWFPSLCQESG